MLVFVVIFIVAPIVEFYVIVKVAHVVGVLAVLAWLVVAAMLGWWLIRHEGIRILRRFFDQVAARRAPTAEIADAFVLAVAGSMLIAPGLISDIIGLTLVIPPIRRAAGRYLVRRYTGRIRGSTTVITATYDGPIDVRSEEADPTQGFTGPPPELTTGSDDEEPP